MSTSSRRFVVVSLFFSFLNLLRGSKWLGRENESGLAVFGE